LRGAIGAAVNQMQAAQNVENVQVQNITSAQNAILAANMPQVVSNLSKYLILQQTGVYALGQANSAQQGILRLLQ
jgi:flagellin